MPRHDELRAALAAALNSAAGAQDAGLLRSIGDHYDKFETLVSRDPDSRHRNLQVAITFWDFWIDSRNHDWLYYPGMTASSWPPLARSIAEDLSADRDITSERVLRLVLPGPSQPSKLRTFVRVLLGWARRRTKG
jgi:hypothetical protein